MARANRTRLKDIPCSLISTGDVSRKYTSGTLVATSTTNLGVDHGSLNQVKTEYKNFTDQILSGPYVVPKVVGDVWIGDPPFRPCLNTKSWTNLQKSPPTTVTYKSGTTTVVTDFAGYPQHNVTFGLVQPSFNLGTLGHGFTSLETIKLAYFGGQDLIYAREFIKNSLLTDEKMLGMKEAFNVLLFIAELKDLRKLPDLFKKWKVSDSDISDKYLGVNFGLLPLFADAKAIMERIVKLDPAIQRWNEMALAGKTMNLHGNFPPPAAVLNHKAFAGYENGVATLKFTTLGRSTNKLLTFQSLMSTVGYGDYETTQRITAKCHVYFKPIPIPDNLIDDLKRHIWGVDKPLQAIWEAIPFSFVIDWFLDLQKYIDAFEQSNPLLKCQIVSVGSSIKVENTVSAKLFLRVSGPGTMVPSGTIDKYEEWYQRYPHTAGGVLVAGKAYSPLELKAINTDQGLLGTALLHQLLRR